MRVVEKNYDPLIGSRKNFILLAHRARTYPDFPLNDLCGAAGRWDGVARCVNSALFISHDLRRDTSIHIILMGPPDPSKIVTIEGRSVKYLNPDERSTVALIGKSLQIDLKSSDPHKWISPGIYVKRGDLNTVLDSIEGNSFLLDENGTVADKLLPSHMKDEKNMNFILSDDRNFTDDELKAISEHITGSLSLGPRVLHSDHSITIAHNVMDRIEGVIPL